MMRIDERISNILAGAVITDNRLQIRTKLDRQTYLQTNKVLEALGGKWSRSLQAHVFEGDPNEAVAAAIASGEVVDWKREFQFFETPAGLADRMVSQGLRGTSLLEPSAGHGAILEAVKRNPRSRDMALYACELNPLCRARLAERFPDVRLVGEDFLAYRNGSPDCVLMNPPFNGGRDIQHVRHAYEVLRPGGRLVAITSPGWTFRQDQTHRGFREWAQNLAARTEELPHGTFKTSGTMVRATLLVIDKT
jgi:hypothetical protein